MKYKNIFNSMGFAGRLGKLGDIIEKQQKDIEKLTKLAKVKVTFDSDGGNKIDDIMISYGNVIAAPPTPSKSGSVFLMWTLNGEEFDFDTGIKDDITLKAAWETSGDGE